jgi:hypothetical protein
MTFTVCPAGMGTSTSDGSSFMCPYAPKMISHAIRFGRRLPSWNHWINASMNSSLTWPEAGRRGPL